ncbi:MAG: phosphoribosylformylglycinamidine synthase subunit PurQ [Planctomycetota bacterium]
MKLNAPKALIITAPGINCDLELGNAFAAAGAEPRSELLQTLVREPSRIAGYDLIGLPGGFSYGDDIAAGRIMGALMARTIYPALRDAISRGVAMICPCNGFQIAVQAGLLPGPDSAGDLWPEDPAHASVALANNLSARFTDRWTRVEIPTDTVCVWTKGLACDQPDDVLPSAHGEGRFVAPAAVVERLSAGGQIAMRYGASDNFNGSVGAIAGICDASGMVFGLMPHPERYTRWTQHPQWTRMDLQASAVRKHDPLGLRIFKNAVEWVREDRRGVNFEFGASLS